MIQQVSQPKSKISTCDYTKHDEIFWSTLASLSESPSYDPYRAAARSFLASRASVIEDSKNIVIKAAPLLNLLFDSESLNNEVVSISSRSLIRGILGDFPKEIRDIYSPMLEDGSHDENWQSKSACWSFKIMKELNDGRYVIKNRSSGMPYVIHTHVDVPFAISRFKKMSCFERALANLHDAFEEGQVFEFESNKAQLRTIDLSRLPSFLPQDSIGNYLRIGIAALTETPLKQFPSTIDLQTSRKEISEIASVVPIMHKDEEFHPKCFETFFIKHTHVFGGLALQVRETAKKWISSFNETKAAELLSVEIADRISDVSTIEHYFNSEDLQKYGYFTASERLLCFISRILNMAEKIEDAAQNLSPHHQRQVHAGLLLLNSVLAEKVIDCIPILPKEEQFRLSPAFILRHHEVMKSVQSVADLYMGEFIESKVNGLFELAQ